MAKFKRKRTVRKERAAWVAYALQLEDDIKDLRAQLIACIEERNACQRDFEIMERRYRGE